tara:strand:+ start:2136 stop:3095 length:960 start_codon:yes stop_codon:yes gene_type:complete
MKFKDINLLVTGGCGFIGSNFCNYIYNKINNLIILDKLTYAGDTKYIDNIINEANVFLIIDDILEHDFIETYKKYKINYIIHLAAETHVDNSYIYFQKHINNNIIATQILLNSILNYNQNIKLIHFSTDEIYGESNNDKIFNEESNFNPTNPYAATKACAELIINTYKYSYKLPIIITRCNNVYGLNQHSEKVIPKFISNVLHNKPIEIHGKNNKKRDFIYIDDVISALEIIIEKGVNHEIYNIGINNPINICELADLICTKMKKKNYNIIKVTDRPFNDYRYFINNRKLIELGWKPIHINKKDFEKNIEKIINSINIS